MPHPDLKNSFAAYLNSGEAKERKSDTHQSDWTLEEWKMAVTEVSRHSVSPVRPFLFNVLNLTFENEFLGIIYCQFRERHKKKIPTISSTKFVVKCAANTFLETVNKYKSYVQKYFLIGKIASRGSHCHLPTSSLCKIFKV